MITYNHTELLYIIAHGLRYLIGTPRENGHHAVALESHSFKSRSFLVNNCGPFHYARIKVCDCATNVKATSFGTNTPCVTLRGTCFKLPFGDQNMFWGTLGGSCSLILCKQRCLSFKRTRTLRDNKYWVTIALTRSLTANLHVFLRPTQIACVRCARH